MPQRQHETTTPDTVQQSATPEATTVQPPQLDLRLHMPPGAGGESRPQTHAAALSEASGGRLSRTGGSLLQLQRAYGNRYVQQVVELARTPAPPSHLTPPALVRPQPPTASAPSGKKVIQAKGRIAGDHEDTLANPRPNKTGLPDHLKTGIEHLSGYSMDDVRVHYNSDSPAQVQALAYTQGTDIHVAPGQEKHLPHEAWHVVQQAQGRVRPTLQMQGKVNVNNDARLETEANDMGAKALTHGLQSLLAPQQMSLDTAAETQGAANMTSPATRPSADGTIQRKLGNRGKEGDWVWWDEAGFGVDPKGKIIRVNRSRTPVVSKKHKNMVFQVKSYLVRMSDLNLPEDEVERKVLPNWEEWHLTPRNARQPEEEQADEAEEKEDKRGTERLLGKGSAMSKFKGGATAGGVLAGFAGGYAKKTGYNEGNIDKAIDTLDTVASLADKLGYAFPPIKAITTPVSLTMGGINLTRLAGRMGQLLGDEQSTPLTFAQLDEAAAMLAEIPQEGLRSDEVNQLEKAQEAIVTVRLWLEKMSGEAEGD